MHRPAFPLAAAGRGTEELEEQFLDREPPGQGMAVAAKGRGDEISFLDRRADADGRGLLALALVNRAGHGSFEEEELDPLLELADQDHAPIETEEEGTIETANGGQHPGFGLDSCEEIHNPLHETAFHRLGQAVNKTRIRSQQPHQ